MKVCLITERGPWGKLAEQIIREFFATAMVIYWADGEPFPNALKNWAGDLLLSVKSDLVLPIDIINSAKLYAINFHPASPEYRGVGGHYHAVIQGSKRFGVTCHHLTDKIDAGPIVNAEYFDILSGESAIALKYRTDIACMRQLIYVLALISDGIPLSISSDKWKGHIYLRRQVPLPYCLTMSPSQVDTQIILRQAKQLAIDSCLPKPNITLKPTRFRGRLSFTLGIDLNTLFYPS